MNDTQPGRAPETTAFPMQSLPTLHRSVARAFMRVVLAFGCLGGVLMLGVFFAGRLPDLLVRMNYDSVAYARHMEEAANGLRFPDVYGETPDYWRTAFHNALNRARDNITEQDERAVVDALGSAWERFGAAASGSERDAAYAALRVRLDALVKVNERGMFRRLDENALMRDFIVLLGALMFLGGTIWAFFQADAIAARIAHPLRRAAEVFKDRPSLRGVLHLPEPQTLEVRILFDELERLWTRLGELEGLNVDALVEEKNKLEVILNAAEDAVLVLNAAGTVAHAGGRMLEILGLPAGAVRGKLWIDLSTAAPNYRTLREALKSDLQGSRDVELRPPSRISPSSSGAAAETVVFAARRRELPGGRGQVYLLSDVTEKRRRAALRSEMMDWISHELKTPVQSLGLAADLLDRRQDMDENMAMLVSTVRQDAARLRTVAGQFMDIARMSPYALSLRPERVVLAARIVEWLGPFQLVAREGGVALEFRAGPEVPAVDADPERFAWVVSNLVSNALRVTPPGGHVWVSVEAGSGGEHFGPAGGRCAVLKVADDGPGMPPELEERLFQPYSHGRAAGTREGLTGLGLAITRNIVEAHGGLVRYARRPGGGSVFTVLLPPC